MQLPTCSCLSVFIEIKNEFQTAIHPQINWHPSLYKKRNSLKKRKLSQEKGSLNINVIIIIQLFIIAEALIV